MKHNTSSDDKRDLVVIVMDGPLSRWQENGFGIPFYRARGIDVVCFSVRILLGTGDAETGDIGDVSYLADVNALGLRLDQAGHVYVFSYFDLAQSSFSSLASALRVRGINWCSVRTGAIPPSLPPRNLREVLAFRLFHLRRLTRVFGFFGLVKKTLEKFARRADGADFPPLYLLCEGRKSVQASDTGARIIPGHSRDMEAVITQGIVAATPPRKICIFIDQNEPGHSDWALQGILPGDLPDERWYVDALLNCFTVIEQETGLRVLVQPHPRASYPLGYFGRFELSATDTIRAVADAALVVSHYSTAIGIATIFDRPLLLLTADCFRRRMGGRSERQILAFANALGAPTISMNDPDRAALRNWRAWDHQKYSDYRADYVEYPGAPRQSMWATALGIMNHESSCG